MGRKRVEVLSTSDIALAPIRHFALPAPLVKRIENVAAVFAEVDGKPVQHWVEDFQRDQHPEAEVSIWEGMAAAYTLFTKDRTLSRRAKQEAFALLLHGSINPDRTRLAKFRRRKLTKAEAADLMATFDKIANAKIVAD